jgi:hypothetical protein
MEYGVTRSVQGDLILSPGYPRAAVRYHYDFIYLGDLQYIAHETRHVEQFIFISPNGIGHATRMLLVHFEGFLENREGSYPDLPLPVEMLNGVPYGYEFYAINLQDDFARFPGSDLAHAASYVRQRAYTLAGDWTMQRFQRFVSQDERNLFTITYLEVLDDPSLAPELLNVDSPARAALRERALKSFSILPEEA